MRQVAAESGNSVELINKCSIKPARLGKKGYVQNVVENAQKPI